MAGVFLSYDRDDSEKARAIASALEKGGHSVWWDLQVRGGAQFSKVIEEALKAADVVVVLWSKNSVDSAWVRDEAAVGRDSGRLIPTTIDGTGPPLGFRQFQTIELKDWKRGGRADWFKELTHAIESIAGEVPPPDVAQHSTPRLAGGRRFTSWLVAVPLAAAFAVTAYMLWPTSSAVPTVAVEPLSSNSTAEALTRDLFAKLGSLQSSNTNALQLVGQESSKDLDLIFKVDGANDVTEAKASLLLLDGHSQELLWSNDFKQPIARQADLRQQLAYSAAGVLACATDAFSGSGNALDAQTRRLYLNGCGSFANIVGNDANTLVPIFREVTRRAPRFEDGWRKLIYVQNIVLFSPPSMGNEPRKRALLQRDIASARKINPDMPEAYIAESDLVPQDQFIERMRLVDLAAARNPGSPVAIAGRAFALQQVGRMNEAVLEARRAVHLSPFSPVTQDAYISALTYAGQFESAVEELRKADILWPGASYVPDARYRLNLRYGPPEAALNEIQARELSVPAAPQDTIYLKARMQPTQANVDRAIEGARRRYQDNLVMASDYIQTLATFGRTEELLTFLLNWRRRDQVRFVTDVLFRPIFRDFWRDRRSLQVAAHHGILKYWETTNRWPDFCSAPDLPYECKKEATKLGA